MVIHFTNAGRETGSLDSFFSSSAGTSRKNKPCSVCKDRPPDAGVVMSCLDCFLKNGQLRRFRYSTPPSVYRKMIRGMCSKVPSDPPSDVIHRAISLLEIGFGTYSLFRKNCEDFAVYCKTGYLVHSSERVGQSTQMHAIRAAAAILRSGRDTSDQLGSEACCREDIGSRAERVSLEELAWMIHG